MILYSKNKAKATTVQFMFNFGSNLKKLLKKMKSKNGPNNKMKRFYLIKRNLSMLMMILKITVFLKLTKLYLILKQKFTKSKTQIKI